jgi:hypothetical protein
MKKNFTLVSLCILMGCTSAEVDFSFPEPLKEVVVAETEVNLLIGSTLSLEQALQLARIHSPALAAAQFQINAKRSLHSAVVHSQVYLCCNALLNYSSN